MNCYMTSKERVYNTASFTSKPSSSAATAAALQLLPALTSFAGSAPSRSTQPAALIK